MTTIIDDIRRLYILARKHNVRITEIRLSVAELRQIDKFITPSGFSFYDAVVRHGDAMIFGIPVKLRGLK